MVCRRIIPKAGDTRLCDHSADFQLDDSLAMNAAAARHPVINATLWMMGALASFMAMALGGREMSGAGMSTFQILLVRSLVGLIIVSALLARTGWQQISLRRIGLHTARNLGHFAGQYGWFYGIAFIPLA